MISANGVEYKNLPEQVQYLTEQVADIWVAIENINPPDLTQYAKITYVDSADAALGLRIDAVEGSIGTLLTKTEAAATYAKIADIGTYINLDEYVKTVDMYVYVQSQIKNFDLDSNTDFAALKSRVSNAESSIISQNIDINNIQDDITALQNETVGSTGGFEKIRDINNHLRFVEGDITMNTIEGVTQTYGKWSLSGTHLMVVIAGTMLTGYYKSGGLASIVLPSYIASKIHPLVGSVVEYKTIPAYDSNYSYQNLKITLYINGPRLSMSLGSAITNTADRSFRIQFDLLIDAS
jgi:hypothetical protein